MVTDTELNRLIFRKLMPLLIAAYIIAFIDRTNIGLAKTHLEADLGLSAAAYGLGAGLFSWRTRCARFRATSSCTASAPGCGSPGSW